MSEPTNSAIAFWEVAAGAVAKAWVEATHPMSSHVNVEPRKGANWEDWGFALLGYDCVLGFLTRPHL